MEIKRLILFTNSYPFGIGELWKHNELKLMSKSIEEILVIPFSDGGNNKPKVILNDNIRFTSPLFHSTQMKLSYFEIIKVLCSSWIIIIIKEFVHLNIKISRKNLIKLFCSALRAKMLLDNETIKELLKSDKSETILYFYWGLGSAEILPFIDVSKFKKIVVRMHRYDLYEYENNNYIPFRKQLLNQKITILPSSDDGLKHLKAHYPKHMADIRTQRCGVLVAKDVTFDSSDEKIKIVSCSFLVPVKRISLMIEAAALLNIPFEWHHIGSGQLEIELKELVRLNNIDDRFKFIGKIDSELVLDYYLQNNFDLFVNTSRSEGVPFSIMEAFSVAIPVIAADAGGTKEIVDESVGCLLKNDLIPIELKNAIENYYFLSEDEKSKLRQNAFVRFREKCDMEKLTQEFIEILKK